MIVLTKKKLAGIIGGFVTLLLVFSFHFQIAQDKKNNTVETASFPVTNKTIVLDAGHGVPDERC